MQVTVLSGYNVGQISCWFGTIPCGTCVDGKNLREAMNPEVLNGTGGTKKQLMLWLFVHSRTPIFCSFRQHVDIVTHMNIVA